MSATILEAESVGRAWAGLLEDGRACLGAGRHDAAVGLLRQVVALAPGAVEARVLLARALEGRGDKHAARLLWLEMARQSGMADGQHLWRLARNAVGRGDHAEAERMLGAYLAAHPGDLAAAELLLESRLALTADSPGRHALLDAHGAEWPHTAFFLACMAGEAAREHDPRAARAILERAAAAWTSSIPAAIRIAAVHEALGEAEAGLAMLDRAIAVHPHVPGLWRARLRLAQAAGRPRAALLPMAERLVALEPDKPGPLVIQARLLAHFKDWSGAAQAWRRALDLDRGQVEHWRGLMSAYGRLERNAAIDALLAEARVHFSARGEAGLLDLAVLEALCGWHDRAVVLATGAMANPRLQARARAVAAEALLQGGHYMRAWTYLSAAVREGAAEPHLQRMAVRCAVALRSPAPGPGLPSFPGTLFERALLHPPPRPLIEARPAYMLVTSSLSAGGAERQVALSAAGVARHLAAHGGGQALLVGQDLNPDRGRAMMRPLAETPGLLIEDLGGVDGASLFRGIAAAEPAARPVLDLVSALPPNIARDVVKLYDGFRRHRPCLVHLWQDGVITAGSVAAVLAGVPRIVASMRNVVASETDRRRYRPYLPVMYRALAQRPEVRFTANSAAGAADYERWLGMPAGRIQVLRNGLELDAVRGRGPAAARQAVRAELGLPPGALLVGGTFRLAPAKRPHLWIGVAAQVAARMPDSHFVIVGDGALRAELEALIASLGLSSRITLAGRRHPVEPWIGAMDAMLLASEVEGLPNVLMEAQALGVPVVTTNAGGSAEAVLDGVTGVLAASDDTATLAQAVLRVLADEAMRARARIGAPVFVEQRFGLTRMVAETLATYGLTTPHPQQGLPV